MSDTPRTDKTEAACRAFDGLPAYAGSWDGHDTPEKYRRVGAALASPTTEVPK